MKRATIGCGEYKRQRCAEEAANAVCHGCGRVPDCQGCMECFSYIEGIEDKEYHRQYTKLISDGASGSAIVEMVRKDLDQELSRFNPADTTQVIQITNMLFEAAVALTAMGRDEPVASDEDAKLGTLNQHAWDGVAMVNGYDDEE